ncbi:MAG: DUF4062 domain-containing protein [Chlorobium sp.]
MNNTVKNRVVLASSMYDQNHNQLLVLVRFLTEYYGFDVRLPLDELSINADLAENAGNTYEEEEMFLGFITPSYGISQDSISPSIIHQEIQSAINLNKRRWLLAHNYVVFARQLLRDLGYETAAQRRDNLNLKINPASITDLRVIDMYDDAIRDSEPVAERYGNWVHKYYSEIDVLRFVSAQFYHAQRSVQRYESSDENPSSGDAKKKPAAERQRIIMVSSTVYGIEELLERIYSILINYGYDVWMSHTGTIPVDSKKTAFENCKEAVEKCDLFLSIITPSYGSGREGGNPSITHQEILMAKKLNKPRFLLTHENVLFAKNLLDDLGFDSSEKRQRECKLKGGSRSISDLRVIDMYEESIDKEVQGKRTLHAQETFYRFQEVESFIKAHLVDPEKVMLDAERLRGEVL